MHLHKTINRNEIEADWIVREFVTPSQLDSPVRCEIWCSDFSDPGGDYCEFRFFGAGDDHPFFVKKQEGY